MNKTSIEWVKNPDGSQGYTWNPITGCLNHIKGMCKGGDFPCYAYKLANGRLRTRYLANSILPTHDEPNHEVHHQDPFYPRFWPSRIYKARLELVNAKPRGIFVCDMGELFGDWLPRDWQDRVFAIIKGNPQHRFYLLTKQPQNLIKFSPFPDNCWVGVTATNRDMYINALKYLGQIRATVKFISFEPLLDEVMPNSFDSEVVKGLTDNFMFGFLGINWVIIGTQTKPDNPPEIAWVEEIVRACDKAGVPVFLKDNLKPILPPFGNELFPPAIRVRQELPK